MPINVLIENADDPISSANTENTSSTSVVYTMTDEYGRPMYGIPVSKS